MTELLVVGKVGKAHGLRGEVYVDLVTDRSIRNPILRQAIASDRQTLYAG